MKRILFMFVLMCSISACTITEPTKTNNESKILGTWQCKTESGLVKGTTKYSNDGSFVGHDRAQIPMQDRDTGAYLILKIIGEWYIDESIVLVDKINVIRVVDIEVNNTQLVEQEEQRLIDFYQQQLSRAVNESSTTRSDIIFDSNFDMKLVDHEANKTTSCLRVSD